VHAASPAVLHLPARHIPRPRLTRLLDEVNVRAILVTAPAGYGKTTLATEWLGSRERVAWYRATPASADLAVFSIGVAEAVTAFAPDALRRVSQRLQVGDQPEHAVQPLAEVLADDLAGWPEDAWLAIDDYHLVMQSPTVDRFVATLLELAPIRLLVTTRRRPPWATARKLLYGELAEVGPAQLAMDEFEATQALGDDRPEAVRALVEQAEGWPALIGMAALTSSLEVPTGRVSDILFRYFADEVLRQEPPEVQHFMLRAAVPASFTLASARSLLGVGEAGEVVERLKDEGLLQEFGDGALGFHPLLRGFLRSRLQTQDPEVFGAIVEASVAAARAQERWDEAFELAGSAGRRDLMVRATTEAAPALMAAWRLETMDRWIRACEPPRAAESGLLVMRAWLLTRFNRFAESEAVARAVLGDLPQQDPHRALAWRVLGTSLAALSRYEEALSAHLEGRNAARSPEELTAALWSAVTAAAALESDALDALVTELEAVPSAHSDDLMLKANARVIRAARTNSLAGVWASVEPLLAIEGQTPPSVRLKLLNAASYLAVCRTDYELARRLGNEARALGRAFRIGVELAWPLVQLAAAELALREFAAAAQTIEEIERARQRNSLLRGQVEVLRAKLVLFKNGPNELLGRVDPRVLRGLPESLRAEYCGLLAIASAAVGDIERAQAEADRAERLSAMIEARFYPRFARLIAGAVKGTDMEGLDCAAAELVLDSAAAEITDAFVVAYRAYPRLLGVVGSHSRARTVAAAALKAANDFKLARDWGYTQEASADRRLASLTSRETEVLILLAEGLSNAEIAERLVVSHSTAKVHVHNVLGKLAVRTRTQAVVAAQRMIGQEELGPALATSHWCYRKSRGPSR
jgi:LuxR family maltose regulon positive regulatory protein